MLYGCESWILSESHLALLESCQAEIDKRTLGLSKYHSNANTLIGLHWPSVTSTILIRKLGFLAKLLKGEEKLSAQVLRTLACEDIYNISLIQQCHTLEHLVGTNHLQSFLQDFATITLSDIKKDILDKDWKHTLHLASSHPSLAIVTVSSSVASSWNSFWDEALDYGVRGTRLMQSLLAPSLDPSSGTDYALTVMERSEMTCRFISIYSPFISQPLVPKTLHTGWKKRTSQSCSN